MLPLLLLFPLLQEPEPVVVPIPGGQPQVAVDGRGRIHLVTATRQALHHVVTGDGLSFGEPVRVARMKQLAVGSRRGPRLALGPEGICVTAVAHDEEAGFPGDLLAWRAGPDGRQWTGPVRINSEPGCAREGMHAMAARTDGRIACAWLDLRSGATEVWASFSDDGGRTWSGNHRVYASPDGHVCECCPPAATFDGQGRLQVLWRNWLEGCRDMWLASVEAGGEAGTAVKLGRGAWPLNLCPMAGGSLAPGDGDLTTVWRRNDVVYRCVPGQRERRLGRGAQPWTAEGPGGAWITWVGGLRSGPLMLLRPGAREAETVAESAAWPVLAAAPGRTAPLVLAWEEPRGGESGRRGGQSRVILRILESGNTH